MSTQTVTAIDNDDLRREAEQREREAARLRVLQAYGTVFSTDSGAIVLEDLMARCGFDANGIERPAFLQGMPFEAVARNEGAKEVMRHILRMAKARVETFKAKMPKETK